MRKGRVVNDHERVEELEQALQQIHDGLSCVDETNEEQLPIKLIGVLEVCREALEGSTVSRRYTLEEIFALRAAIRRSFVKSPTSEEERLMTRLLNLNEEEYWCIAANVQAEAAPASKMRSLLTGIRKVCDEITASDGGTPRWVPIELNALCNQFMDEKGNLL